MSLDTKRKLLSNKKIYDLVLARIRLLSPSILVSIGAEGSFNRDELIKRVESGDRVGEVIAEMEMEWLQSMKDWHITPSK